MGSDALMEKYIKLLLADPTKIPKGVKLFGPIMKRLNDITDDEIKTRRIFTIYT